MSEQEGFEVVDKRKQTETETSEQPKQNAANQAEEAEAAEPDVLNLIMYILNLLAATSWQCLGVIANPVTNQATVDLPQARLAIDTLEAVAKQLEPHVDGAINREITNLMNDLRVNFVERSKEQN